MRSSTSTPQSHILHALLLSIPIAKAQFEYGNNYLTTTKDTDIVASAFPPVDEIDLLSPAFISPETVLPGFTNGTAPPTSDTTIDHFYRSLADRNDWLNYLNAEFRSEEGRSMPYLFLSDPSANNATKLKVYIQGGIHGNEPAGDQTVMALLGKMDANQTWTASLLERLDIKILPRYNPDGIAYFQRQLACNFDGNREHIKLFREQSRNIKQAFMDYSPHISVDMHEFTAPTVYGGDYQHGADALISGGINLNIHPDIRSQVLDNFIPAMGSALQAYSLRWEPYVTGESNSTPGSRIVFEGAVTEARTGRNAYGLTQTISFLLEIRGIRLADQHFQRRVATGLVKLSTILETARDQFDSVYSTVENAREEFISGTDDIVITDSFPLTNRTFTFVDRNNGSIVQVPIDYYLTTPSVANLTRARPEAYLIPRTWGDGVVNKLRNNGIEVTELDYIYRGTAEALNITSSTLDDALYEGTVLNTVTTEPYETEIVLPAGSFLVSTRQKNAALAFIALEPENIDSFVTFNIISVEEGDEYPIYRIYE